MASNYRYARLTLLSCLILQLSSSPLTAQIPFTSSYTDGASWNLLYGQGFNAFVNDNPEVEHEFGAAIDLSRFEFFKAGDPDTAANIQLAIVDNFYMNLDTFTTSSPELIGLSSNTLANTTGIALGSPIRFDFDDLTLNFGDYYGAIFVNEDLSGNLTPVLVSALHANYVETEPGSEVYVPESNYDFDPLNPTDFLTATSNFLNSDEFGTFLAGFEGNGDANFTAYYDHTFANAGPGDFDEDGDIDGDDLTSWLGSYATNGGADADADGDSDGSDFLIWQQNLGTPAMTIAAVPEPAACCLLATTLFMILANRSSTERSAPRS